MLKKYETHQSKATLKVEESESSGVACAEKKCKGQMMIRVPYEEHTNLGKRTGLKRATCNKCSWRGWV